METTLEANRKNKVLIFGAGSIGIFLGTKLYKAGYDVTLFGNRKLKNINETILINNEIYKTPPRIYELKSAKTYDTIFVTTKLYDSKFVIQEIKRLNLKPKLLVFIQNGLVEDSFYEGLESYSGFVTLSIFEGYRLIENQLVVSTSLLGWQTENNDAGKMVCEYLKNAGICCNASADLASLRAEKMMMVNAVGTLSALEKKTVGELVKKRKTKKIIEGILQESYNVLVKDYKLPSFEIIRERFYKTISELSSHYSSMYQDITSGRKTEIEFLNGLIVKLGNKYNIDTPQNRLLYEEIVKISKHTK